MTATAIDLFAGAGGFSEGARAVGVRVLWAANHWQTAVQVHANNHPRTVHVCQDLHQADWTSVPRHDIMLASPSCQGNSRARGPDRPHHDKARATAWAVVSAAEALRPPVVVVENTIELMTCWELFPAWRLAMETLGYAMSTQVLDAADVGVPQHRERLFVVGVRGRSPIEIPHGSKTHVPARSIIDWDSGSWGTVSVRRGGPGPKDGSRAPRSLARIRTAQQRFGSKCMVAYYGQDKGRSLDAPLGTVTTRDRHMVVDGERCRMLTTDESRRAMAFPDNYRLTGSHETDLHLLGNAVPPPLAEHVVRCILSA